MEVITRKEAHRLGRKRYFTGKPCKRGHVAERYSYASCVECLRADVRAQRARHPDQAAAKAGRMRARKLFPGSIPADFDYHTTIPFYRAARHLTRETGIPHEVDHIVALVLGGMHEASNLQVITRQANRKKARVERAKAQK